MNSTQVTPVIIKEWNFPEILKLPNSLTNVIYEPPKKYIGSFDI
jgi:hypothetical protein